jgi:hypothetical protein
MGYCRNEYQEAWSDARLFWDPLTRAAASAQLGQVAEAQHALELRRLRPEFASRARELMRRLIFSEENAKMLLERLHKAGFVPKTPRTGGPSEDCQS